jgi:hypothetical protein
MRFPGFPVQLAGSGALLAAFLNESRIRGCVQRSVQKSGFSAGNAKASLVPACENRRRKPIRSLGLPGLPRQSGVVIPTGAHPDFLPRNR